MWWSLFLQSYDLDIKHIKGLDNMITDACVLLNSVTSCRIKGNMSARKTERG